MSNLVSYGFNLARFSINPSNPSFSSRYFDAAKSRVERHMANGKFDQAAVLTDKTASRFTEAADKHPGSKSALRAKAAEMNVLLAERMGSVSGLKPADAVAIGGLYKSAIETCPTHPAASQWAVRAADLFEGAAKQFAQAGNSRQASKKMRKASMVLATVDPLRSLGLAVVSEAFLVEERNAIDRFDKHAQSQISWLDVLRAQLKMHQGRLYAALADSPPSSAKADERASWPQKAAEAFESAASLYWSRYEFMSSKSRAEYFDLTYLARAQAALAYVRLGELGRAQEMLKSYASLNGEMWKLSNDTQAKLEGARSALQAAAEASSHPVGASL